jgi:hypothetical protein
MASIPDTTKPDIYGERDATTYSQSGTVLTFVVLKMRHVDLIN